MSIYFIITTNNQKRADIHKIVLSRKLCFPPHGESVNLEDFLLICAVFPHFLALFGGGGVKPNFADKNFMDTQTFLKQSGLREGMCRFCGARLRTLLPHKCRIPPVPFPPLPCPSFPWLFCEPPGVTSKFYQGFSFPAESTKTLEKTRENAHFLN